MQQLMCKIRLHQHQQQLLYLPAVNSAPFAIGQIINATCPLIARREELGIFFLCC
jgi:hypothetical protein